MAGDDSGNQTITLTPEERKILRAALASYKDHCATRAAQYDELKNKHTAFKAYQEANTNAAKEYGQMRDDALRLICRIEE